MTEQEFREMVDVYKQFYYDEISREEAEEQIGDWEEVSQVASMQLCREEQEQPTDEEIREMFTRD